MDYPVSNLPIDKLAQYTIMKIIITPTKTVIYPPPPHLFKRKHNLRTVCLSGCWFSVLCRVLPVYSTHLPIYLHTFMPPPTPLIHYNPIQSNHHRRQFAINIRRWQRQTKLSRIQLSTWISVEFSTSQAESRVCSFIIIGHHPPTTDRIIQLAFS